MWGWPDKLDPVLTWLAEWKPPADHEPVVFSTGIVITSLDRFRSSTLTDLKSGPTGPRAENARECARFLWVRWGPGVGK